MASHLESRIYVYFSKYVQVGCVILIFSGIVLWGFVLIFERPIQETHGYHKNICLVTSKHMLKIKFDCWSKNLVDVVDMPCVIALVDTKQHRNIKFYRSFEEKLNAYKYNCSYLPTACENNFDYMNDYLREHIDEYFPKNKELVTCHTRNENGEIDAIFKLPDKISYELSLFLSIFGIVTGLGMILYGISSIILTDKKYFKLSKYRCTKSVIYKIQIKRELEKVTNMGNTVQVNECFDKENIVVACTSAQTKYKISDEKDDCFPASSKRSKSLNLSDNIEMFEIRRKYSARSECYFDTE